MMKWPDEFTLLQWLTFAFFIGCVAIAGFWLNVWFIKWAVAL